MSDSSEKWRFGLIANSQRIADGILAVTDSVTENIRVVITPTEHIEARARQLIIEGCEVLIGHGSVGEVLLPIFGYSAVHIPKSDSMILDCLREAAKYSSNVAITTHANEDFDHVLFESVLGIHIERIPYTTDQEIREGIQRAYQRGITVVVGGGTTCNCIEGMGGVGVMIRPDPRLTALALKQARAIAATKRNEEWRKHQLFSILRLIDDGVVAVDGNGVTVFANARAHAIFGSGACREGEPFPENYAASLALRAAISRNAPGGESIISINKKRYVTHAVPLAIQTRETGAVAFIKDVGSLEDINRRVKAALYDRGLVSKYNLKSIVGTSPSIQAARQKGAFFAVTDAPVLIEGETGTGKELFAHALHQASHRQNNPFVATDCSALPESLLESELFGYEEGAFTGARRGGKAGLFEMAHTGTLFVDEIGEMPPSVQQKLLRVLETKEVMRIGGDRVLPLDVRIIAATNRDLAAMVRRGAFRMDLFFRIASLRLHIPPLRERLRDVPDILAPLLARYGRDAATLSPAMLQALTEYSWPGNIRELLAFMEAFLALDQGGADRQGLFTELLGSFRQSGLEQPGQTASTLKQQLDIARLQIATRTVSACNGNKGDAAQKLGISYNTLWRILGGDLS